MLAKYFTDNWGLLSFILSLIFMGLFYQVAWQYPVIDSFPLIERLLDPNYLAKDFFTNTFSEFSPRLVSANIIIGLSKLFNIDYPYIVAFANIVRIWLYGIGLYLFFLNLAGRSIAIIAFTLSALSFLSIPFLPAWWPITYDLTSSNIALTFAMFSWATVLKNNIHISLTFLALSVFIHPVVGIHAFIISIILFISSNSFSEFIKLFKALSIYPFALLFSVAFFYNYLSYQQILPDQEFIDINALFRHGHHFIFSHMEIEKWISTLLMLIITIAIAEYLDRGKSTIIKKITYVIILYSIMMMVMNYLFVELVPVRFMVSFIPMRSFPIIVPIIILAVARLAHYHWKKENFCIFFLLFIPFLPYNHVGLTWYLLPNHHELVLPIALILLVASIILMEHFNKISFRLIDKNLKKLFHSGSIAVYMLPITVLALLLAIFRFNINIPTFENSPKIYQWLSQNTHTEDIIVTELNAANNQKVRLLARRAIVISKDFPFNELFYRQWYQRYTDLYGHRDTARGHIDSLSESTSNLLLDKYQAQILIRTQAFIDPTYFTLIGESQGEKSTAYIYRNNEVPTHE